jgi:hypothetical protein
MVEAEGRAGVEQRKLVRYENDEYGDGMRIFLVQPHQKISVQRRYWPWKTRRIRRIAGLMGGIDVLATRRVFRYDISIEGEAIWVVTLLNAVEGMKT